MGLQNNNQQLSNVWLLWFLVFAMPSRRSRSRSRQRNRSESPERRVDLPKGVSPISEADYFQKSDEFRLWLKEEKGKVRCCSIFVLILLLSQLVD